MEGFPVSDEIRIQSHKGEYTARFIQGGMDQLNETLIADAIYIVDSRVADLYQNRLANVFKSERVLCIEANEQNKSLDKFPKYVDALVNFSIRRGQPLVAIGGGIIQDITCFLATTMMRGLPWVFYPTTLLAQADSCIGSKSSINSGEIKNILGTFTPPDQIIVDVDFLETLEKREILSGIGEMIKVHAIDSPEAFNHISEDYDQILKKKTVMEKYIHNSLLVKKTLIELDEFDQGPRNVMNYGHSFGHAVESATNYGIPHGIAVTIGMDMANFIAARLGVSNNSHFERMHGVLKKNYASYKDIEIDIKRLMSALKKDKKNTSTQLRLILPDMEGKITIGLYDNTPELEANIIKYLNSGL
jgi:3-dehydroquinate synthase